MLLQHKKRKRQVEKKYRPLFQQIAKVKKKQKKHTKNLLLPQFKYAKYLNVNKPQKPGVYLVNVMTKSQSYQKLPHKYKVNKNKPHKTLGLLAGSVGRACNSLSQSFEFKPHVGHEVYLKTKTTKHKQGHLSGSVS